MNVQSSQNNPQSPIEQRIRTVRILWGSMFSSVVLYYLLTLFVGPRTDVSSDSPLSLALLVVGLTTIPLSFLIKKRLLAQAVEQQRPGLVQQGYIIAWAITEVAALLGLLDFFSTGHRHYYVLFSIAAGALLLHFPRRQHVLDASFKKSAL